VCTSRVLRRRRVCDAGPQTGLRLHPRASRRPRGRPPQPNIMPPMPCRNTTSPLVLSFFFSPQCSPWDDAFPAFQVPAGVAIGWARAAGGGSRCHCKAARPDDFRIFSHPALCLHPPYQAKGFFKVVTSRTDPHRSSFKPGPAKQSCTPSLILRSP
jgi:hypothetical protein